LALLLNFKISSIIKDNYLKMKHILKLIVLVPFLLSCKSSKVAESQEKDYLSANKDGKGPEVILEFEKGREHNHPSFVLWAEDPQGKYIQTLFITESLGTGVFGHGDASSGKWMPGEIVRPAAVPYWAHKRGVITENGLYMPTKNKPVPDAYTGATPAGDFKIRARLDNPVTGPFRILFEINQSWDWNEYWTNNKYPDDKEYKSSCQPALVYMAEIDLANPQDSYEMKVIGHSHYSGKTGELFTDLSTITTALEIAKKISIVINP
jgi:hypothetical protein